MSGQAENLLDLRERTSGLDTHLTTFLSLATIQGMPHLSSLQVSQEQNGEAGNTRHEGWVRVSVYACVCMCLGEKTPSALTR